MLPNSRDTFKEYCKRRLGAPVINLELDDDQVDDRVDEALDLFRTYHCEGSEVTYYKALLTQTDIDNKYLTLPENIIGTVDIFPIGQSLNTNNMFNIRYQIALNDLYTLTSVSMVPYYMALQHIQFLEMLLVGQQPLRYTRSKNICYIDMSWDIVKVGDYLVLKCYQVIDPDEYTRTWADPWLLRYGTCLVKMQWGTNLKKYSNVQLPGGTVFNGQKIFDEAMAEKADLERELIQSYSLPISDMIG